MSPPRVSSPSRRASCARAGRAERNALYALTDEEIRIVEESTGGPER